MEMLAMPWKTLRRQCLISPALSRYIRDVASIQSTHTSLLDKLINLVSLCQTFPHLWVVQVVWAVVLYFLPPIICRGKHVRIKYRAPPVKTRKIFQLAGSKHNHQHDHKCIRLFGDYIVEVGGYLSEEGVPGRSNAVIKNWRNFSMNSLSWWFLDWSACWWIFCQMCLTHWCCLYQWLSDFMLGLQDLENKLSTSLW